MPSTLLPHPPPMQSAESAEADRSLLERIRGGDKGAMAELYDRNGAKAYGLAYNILNDRGAAEDAVQDAFTTLWRQAPRLDPERGRVSALLMTVVHRRAIDILRRRRGQTAQSLDASSIDVEQDAPAAIDLIDAEQRRACVQRAVGALPRDQRRTVQLAYFEGRTRVEIASIMGVPGGTVKSRLRLAMEKLRAGLVTDLAY